MDVVTLIRDHEALIVDEATEQVLEAHLRHYGADQAQTHARLRSLLDLLLASIERRDVTDLVAYARDLARDRFDAGYDLSEVQSAFNALEEVLWRRILADVPPAGMADALGSVTTALGAGKDALARAYVTLAGEAHAPSIDLSRLFEGTDGV